MNLSIRQHKDFRRFNEMISNLVLHAKDTMIGEGISQEDADSIVLQSLFYGIGVYLSNLEISEEETRRGLDGLIEITIAASNYAKEVKKKIEADCEG